MKNYIIIAIIFCGLFGCSEDYLDVNTDPNNPTSATPDLILPVGQNYTARWMHADRFVSHLGSMLMYQWSESAGYSWYNDEFLYLVNSTFYSNIFDWAYTDALKQYAVLDKADPEVYGAYIGISKIMKAYTYQILVDFYGDIPYSEALGRSENPTPAYNSAEDIYDDLIVQLTDAITILNEAESNVRSELPEGDDVMFGGDLLKWKQFANTIKLRILNRVRAAKGNDYVAQELAVISQEGSGFITEDVAVNPGYENETFKQNPFWEDFGKEVGGAETLSGKATCATDYYLQRLQTTNDPRINTLFEEPDTGHKGVGQGVEVSIADYTEKFVSNFGPGILSGPDQDAIIMTLAERYFNQAELALNGLGGNPEDLYNSGVTASMMTQGLSAAEATAYLGQNMDMVNYQASANKLEAIIYQKWIACTGFTGEQTWFDHSRTGFPANLPVSQEAPNLRRPVRLAYPASEVSGNATNVPSQPDVFTEKLFWAN